MRLRISSETVRPPHLESAGEEGLEVRIVDPSDVKEGGGLVEGAAGTGEHRAHFISDAAEKDVGCVGLKLDLAAHCREDGLCVLDIKHILKLVEDDTEPVAAGMVRNHVQNVFRCTK